MSLVCAHCGTEVDEGAYFCPTCGQALATSDADAAELPPAPSWPEHEPIAPSEPAAVDEPAAAGEPPVPDQPTSFGAPTEAAPPARSEPAVAPPLQASPHPDTGDAAGRPRPQLPISWPVTLSGWLIGGGALIGIVAMFLPWLAFSDGFTAGWGLASGLNVLFALVLAAVVALVFLSVAIPAVPHRQLIFLVIGAVGVGIGLDRVGLGATGFGALLFLLAMLAAAAGALLVELGLDRPMGGLRG